ncbi:TetR family transcriptional regulator [Saccharothrix deserti]|uniref:TetR family transcriptional regulator n=1 Tax=Saccharothrix deserti TaxID=2593674 RepID=UPI00131C6209
MAAAVRLVSERGTTAIAVTDLTEAADVSRKLLYMHFGDRDALLVAAAVDLVERKVIRKAEDAGEALRPQVLALARHFAEHRPFYRPMLTGSCAFAMTRTLNDLFASLNRTTVRELFGELPRTTQHDLALFLSGGASAVTNDWLLDGADPLDPEELADRLLGLASVLTPTLPSSG